MMSQHNLPDLVESQKRRAEHTDEPLPARETAPPADLATVSAELVRIRSELRQQTLASRELHDQSEDTLEILRKAVAKNENATVKSAKESFLGRARAMIAIADSLEPSMVAAKKLAEPRRRFWRKKANPAAKALVVALELTQRRIITELSALQVHRIETTNRPFDPETMEAAEAVADSQLSSGTVVEEIMTGYKSPEQIVRYARVVVSR